MALDVLQGFNLYADDVDKWLGLSKLKMPALEDETVDFRPGGGSMEFEVALGLKKLAMPFSMKTVDTQLLGLFGLGASIRKRFSAYGYVVDEHTGAQMQVVVTVRGRLMKAEQADLQPKELAEYDYAVGAITYYHRQHDGVTIHRLNAETNEQVVNGVDQNTTRNRLLAIGGRRG